MPNDLDDFTEQLVHNQPRIFAYIVTLMPNRDDAEDVYQGTCLTLWKQWKEYSRPDNFFAWACGIAHNQVRNRLRTTRRNPIQLSDDVLQQVAETRVKADGLLESRSRYLGPCLAKLSDEQRRLVERCYLGDEMIRTIADEMQISAAALTMRLQRIRKILFECVELGGRSREGGEK